MLTEMASGVLVFDGPTGLAGVGSSVPVQKAFLAPMEVSSGVNTGLAIQNLEDRQMEADLELTTLDGSFVASGSLELGAYCHIARFVDQLSWATSVDFNDFRGLLKVEVSGRVGATAIQQRGSEFATMPVA